MWWCRRLYPLMAVSFFSWLHDWKEQQYASNEGMDHRRRVKFTQGLTRKARPPYRRHNSFSFFVAWTDFQHQHWECVKDWNYVSRPHQLWNYQKKCPNVLSSWNILNRFVKSNAAKSEPTFWLHSSCFSPLCPFFWSSQGIVQFRKFPYLQKAEEVLWACRFPPATSGVV